MRKEAGEGSCRRKLGGLRTGVAGDQGFRSTANPLAVKLFSVVISCGDVGVGKAGQSEALFVPGEEH